MKDNAEKDSSTKNEAAPKKPPATTKVTAAKKTPPVLAKQKTGTGISWFAILLVICATGAGFFAFNQLNQQIVLLSNDARSTEQAAVVLTSSLQTKSDRLNGDVSSLAKKLTDFQQQTIEKTTLLQKQVGKNRHQWLIAEAEYLSGVANSRLLLAGDLATATAALQAADQRLKENGDPLVFPIRKQLAKEINILKSTQLPDIVGISSQLLALESAVANMEITQPHAGTVQSADIGKGDRLPIPESIQNTLSDAWGNFSKLIVIRRSDTPIAALMTPERVELIRKNLALKLETARVALVNKNEALYTASITACAQWLGDYFDPNNPAVKTALEQLDVLKNTTIKARLPSIALSLKMLRDLPLLNSTEQAKKAPITPTAIIKKVPSKRAAIHNELTKTSPEEEKEDAKAGKQKLL